MSDTMTHSLTCPVCGKLGYTETDLQSHVTSEHQNCTTEVVCPICASMPGGEPNLVTDDFPSHLTVEHRQQPRDTYVEDTPSSRHSLRRVNNPARSLGGIGRGRRPNMHFGSGGLSPSGARESVDPIAELLSQLSGVRRAAAVPYDRVLHRHTSSSQQSQTAQAITSSTSSGARRSVFPPPPSGHQAVVLNEATVSSVQHVNPSESLSNQKSEKHSFLLDKLLESQRSKDVNPEHSLFLQDLLLAAMTSLSRTTLEEIGQK